MIDYKTYRNSAGSVTVENQKQRTEHGEYKDVILSRIGKPPIVTYDEYNWERLVYLVNELVALEGRTK